MKLLAKNKRAYFDYDITDKLVAGVELMGAEVKSSKLGHASLKGSFVTLKGGELWLTNAHITPYKHAGNAASLDPVRPRKLLMHKKQIQDLAGQIQQGRSVLPLALLQERNLIKLEIGVGRGKKQYDKRATMKKRDVERDIDRQIKR